MPFPFSAVLFDLDGTLVDSASDITSAINRLLAEARDQGVAIGEGLSAGKIVATAAGPTCRQGRDGGRRRVCPADGHAWRGHRRDWSAG